jgi:hypothetical protein
MLRPVPIYLVGHELVTAVYNHWPSFHDAEVISLSLDRSHILFDEIYNPRIDLAVYCMAMVWNGNAEQFENVKRTLINFEFDEVSDVKIDGFNHQNAILGMEFEELPVGAAGNHSFKIIIDPAGGVACEFIARRGRIASVSPYQA